MRLHDLQCICRDVKRVRRVTFGSSALQRVAFWSLTDKGRECLRLNDLRG